MTIANAATYMGFVPDTETQMKVSDVLEDMLDRAPLGSECVMLLKRMGANRAFHGFAKLKTAWGTFTIRAQGLRPQFVARELSDRAKGLLQSLKPKIEVD